MAGTSHGVVEASRAGAGRVPCGGTLGWWHLACQTDDREAPHERFPTFLAFDHNMTLNFDLFFRF